MLNKPIGGLNPAAVEVALQLGAKAIWMPTLDADRQFQADGMKNGISILSEDREIRTEVLKIIDLVRQADAILATGHISVEESLHLIKACRKQSLGKILVTHPEASVTRMPIETQIELAGEDLFFERCFVDTTSAAGYATSLEEIAERIRRIGVGSTVLTTDFGLATLPTPVVGMRHYLTGLLDQGLNETDLRQMAGNHPVYLLDL